MGAFKKAVKSGIKLRLAITGPAGSGKTYTALRIATEMGLPIAYIDTEHGSASKYADLFDFDVMEMKPPFTPSRFVKGIQMAADEGYKVVVIDSLSHAWNGTGGILEMVEDAAKRVKGNTYAAWKEVTPEQNALIEAIVGAEIHIIATMRSKMDYVQQRDDKGYTKIEKVGMAPIQRDGFEYEFDVVMDMDIHHNGVITKTRCRPLTDKVFKFPGKDISSVLLEWIESDQASADVEAAKQAEKTQQKQASGTSSPGDELFDGKGESDVPTDDELVILGTWAKPDDAKAWAVDIGACENEHEARNSLKKIVDQHGGRLTQENAAQVYLNFLRRQYEKLAEQPILEAA